MIRKKQKLSFSTIIPIVFASFLFVAIGAFFACSFFGQEKGYINISDLPQEFMDEYFSSYAEMAKREDKENILIVTSMHPLENTYGAAQVVEAPNHQYFLYYDQEFKKDGALSKFSRDETLKVQENLAYEYTEDDSEEEGNSGYNSWGIEAMGLDEMSEAINNMDDAENVVVAILDTGLDVDLFNKYFAGKLAETYNVLDPNGEGMFDSFGHGTHIAGTIAEGTPNNVKILPVKMSDSESLDTSDIITAINYIAYYDKANIMNMSFGGYEEDEAQHLAIEAAKQKNIISVAAAGNETTDVQSYPASFDNTLSISAVDSNMYIAIFSNFGTSISFAASGASIKSIMSKDATISQNLGNTDEDDDHETIDGTSMATPHAVSAVAVLKSFDLNLTFDDIMELLKEHVTDLGEKGWDIFYGYGFINFNDATICRNAEIYDCDEFGIFEEDITETIEIPQIIFTPYNYGSLTNILASNLKVVTTNGKEITKVLGDIEPDEIEITGYDPYVNSEQTITVRYDGAETTTTLTNPNNFESGWEYNLVESNKMEITGYKNHNLDIKILYIPAEIENTPVIEMTGRCIFGTMALNEYNTYECLNFIDAPKYTHVIASHNLTKISGFGSQYGFRDLAKFVSLAEEITIGVNYGAAFSSLYRLYSVEANILFDRRDELYFDENGAQYLPDGDFSYDSRLSEVTLSENNSFIPEMSFAGCQALKAIDIPNSVTEIRRNAFDSSGLKEITGGENLEKIGDSAFAFSQLERFYVPATLTTLGQDVFFYATDQLVSLEVSPENPVFDSRDNSNAIIETDTNRLIVGTKAMTIPSSVRTIASRALFSKALTALDIPEGVTTIEDSAIFSTMLEKIVLPASLQSMSQYSFANPYDYAPSGFMTLTGLVYWVHRDSYAHEKAIEYDVPYVVIEEANPNSICGLGYYYVQNVIMDKNTFRAFQEVNSENFLISVRYCDAETSPFDAEPEYISDYNVEYENGLDSLRAGINRITLKFDDAHGYHNLKQTAIIEAEKATPNYEVPTNISADPGQSLSEIILPEGFSWMDEEEIVGGAGQMIYYAKFTPEDTDNYEIVEDIPIPVQVATDKTMIIPEFDFAGGYVILNDPNPINPNNIIVTNMEAGTYEISNVESRLDVSDAELTFTLTMSNGTFEEYYFIGGLQTKEFTMIVPTKYGSDGFEGPYDGEEHTIKFNIDISGCTVRYKAEQPEYSGIGIGMGSRPLDEEDYDLEEMPTFTEIGLYNVHYYITCENRQPIQGASIVMINGIIVDPSILRNNSLRVVNNNLEDLLHKIHVFTSMGAVKLFDEDSNELDAATTENVQTGYTISYTTHEGDYTYNIAVVGDVDGDGDIDTDDLQAMRQHLTGSQILSGVHFLAGDISDDNQINSADLLKMRQHLIGTVPIE